VSEPQCNGICLWAADVGVPVVTANPAYPHPDCPAHGDSDLARMERGELTDDERAAQDQYAAERGMTL
jgi:hypothetical protein